MILQLFFQMLCAFITTIAFSIIFNAKVRHLGVCGIVGALGWGVYWLGTYLDYSSVLSTFLATLVVGLVSYSLAKKRKAPITVFVIAGLIPLVPGVGLYRTMYHLLFMEYDKALEYALLTFQLAGVIAGGIIVSTLFPVLIRPKHFYKKE